MMALVKNDPKWERQVFPPHLMAQAQINEQNFLGAPEEREFDNGGYEGLFPKHIKHQPITPVIESKRTKIRGIFT